MRSTRLSFIVFLGVLNLFLNLFAVGAAGAEEGGKSFKIGWISPLTGPAAKYGADKAGLIAVKDINAAGGILGRPLELIMEDGKCAGPDAAAAVKKLIEIDRVDFILGGHCSTETLAIAPIAEKAKVVTVAAISSSPEISNAGDYIFRVSAAGTVPSEVLADFLREKLRIDRLGILYELTPYVIPPAEYLRERFIALGGSAADMYAFNPGETDFRSLLARIRNKHPQALYLAVQSQDTAALVIHQARQVNVGIQLLGNEVVGNTAAAYPDLKGEIEGLYFAEAPFNPDSSKTRKFVDSFKSTFNVDTLPYGLWTAESYDGVMLLASVINRCGPGREGVKKCLYEVRDYEGASGRISIDENGDGIRQYVVKQVRGGMVEAPEQAGNRTE